MISQLNQTFVLTANQQNTLAGMIPFNRDDWERNTNELKDIKQSITSQLRQFQNGKCCFCGLNYDETGQGQVEHIAPKKAKPKEYPEFSFNPLNLAMACQLCNSSTMKGQYDSIENHNPDYSQCSFKIVHPYLDDHAVHYRWTFGLLRVVIIGRTTKAAESIKVFKLAEESRTMSRAKQRNYERLIALYNLPQASVNRIRAIVRFRKR